MGVASSLAFPLALALGGCNLVLGVVPLSGEDLGGSAAEGGNGAGGAASGGGPAGGSAPGGGGVGGGGGSTCDPSCAAVDWATSFGSPKDDTATGLAVGPNGRIIVSGDFGESGTIDQTPIGKGGYIAQLNAQGVVGGALPGANTSGPIVTIDGAGNAAVAGSFDGDITLGSTPFTGTGAFYAKQSAAGMLTDADVLLGPAADSVRIFDVALGADGAIAICGRFTGTVQFAGAGDATASGANDAFVMMIPSAGSPWLKTYGVNGASNAARVISFREDGALVVGLRKAGVIDLGLESSPPGAGMILLTLDAATGDTVQVSEQFNGCTPLSMVVGADGMIYLGGTTTAQCQLDSKAVGPNTAFAAVIDPAFQSDDSPVPRAWALEGISVANPVAVAPAGDGSGDVLLGASFALDVDSDTLGPLDNVGGLDFIIARLDAATGDPVYVTTFGSDLDDSLSSLVVGPDRAIITGTFASTGLVLGDETLNVVGDKDVFVAALTY